MDNETVCSDVGHIGFTTPIGAIRHMKFVEPNDDFGRLAAEWLGKCDSAASFLLAFIRGVIVHGAEPAELEILIFGVEGEPCAPGRVENGVFP